VTTLAVEGCEAPAPTSGRFASLVALPPHVSVLSLRCCGIEAAELGELLPVLAENPSLTALSLWGNPVGDDGAQALAGALGALRHVNLANSRLGLKGAQALGSALAENETLTSLDVSHNQVGTQLGETLLEALKTNSVLCSLDLRCTGLDEEAQQLLAEEKVREGSGRAKPLEIGLDRTFGDEY